VASAHRDAARGDWLAADELCRVGKEPLEDRRAQTGPDQALRDALPAEPIEPRDELEGMA